MEKWVLNTCRMRMHFQVLHRGMASPSGGALIVISDGEENERPYAEDVMPEVLRKSVVVHTISVTEKADPRMGSISTSSGGQSFFDIGNKDSTGMIDSLATIATSGGLTHDPKVPLLVSCILVIFNLQLQRSHAFIA